METKQVISKYKNFLRRNIKKSYISLISPFKNIPSQLSFLYGHHLGEDSVRSEYLYDNLKRLNKNVAFISFEEACEIVLSNNRVNHPVVCFSFDDGFEEVVEEIAPVLREFKTNCCIFVNPGFVNGSDNEIAEFQSSRFHVKKYPASWRQLKKFCEKGGVVGSHTNNHFRLSELGYEQASHEIIDSKLLIEKQLDISCRYFAWPYGTAQDISDRQLALVNEHYELAFSAIRDSSVFYNSERTINRDHFEGNWSYDFLRYFLSQPKSRRILK
ncbi:MAG: polysaccharide deacetylase family protein [Kangiellaceae bacterium]|nr:polysaccharide deacetylase family protein [Kangiellaceae bacterium]MCW9000085.1 polysaccharide deacetylase family protein [Kangiellaceae bacterium]MCW9016678.1 polysaccharide deacetylase family protein [Kangiellaceae bacterium]